MPAQIRVEGVERVQRHMLDTRLWTGPMQSMLRTAAREAQRVAAQGQPQSIARSLQSEVHGLQANVTSTMPAAVEVGRRAGAPLPPTSAIAAWAMRHGISASPFVLARAIARRGTRGRFFMRAARQHLERRMPTLLSEAARDIERRWRS